MRAILTACTAHTQQKHTHFRWQHKWIPQAQLYFVLSALSPFVFVLLRLFLFPPCVSLRFLAICSVYMLAPTINMAFLFMDLYHVSTHTHAHAATVYFARAIINKDTTFSIRHFLCVCTTKAIANGHCKHTHTSAPEEGQRDKYPMIVLLLSFVDSAMLCCSCSSTVQWTWT